jgi:hypothetical protein
MANSVWPAFATLVGALIGGGIPLTAQRAGERAAAKRHAESLLEARRPERLGYLVAFLQAAQDAERVAKYVHQYGRPDAGERVDSALDRLWISLRPVQLLCSGEVAAVAHTHAVQTHKAVTKGSGQQSIGEFLRPSRNELISAARVDLEAAGDSNPDSNRPS